MESSGRILLVDDDDLVLRSLEQVFRDDYDVSLAGSGEEAVALLEQATDIATVVLDIRMARMNGLETAERIQAIHPDLPIIFYTGYPGDYSEREIDQTYQPFDFVMKSERTARLVRAVRNAVSMYRLKTRSGDLLRLARVEYGLVGSSPAMLDVYRTIEQIAASNNKVMILGPTGTGKELVARAIHRRSGRADQRLAILNCNHKSPDLVESELFGHKRGSFTGAVEDRIGMFEYADGGTLFLDEVGDLDITTQAKLLRVLETGEMQRVGSPELEQVDVRLVCATHRDLEAMVADGRFREDLFYRLKGAVITLPALRDRREDIPDLVNYFAEDYCMRAGHVPHVLAPGAMDLLIGYDWPGNVRQLLDTVEALVDATPSSYITRDDIAAHLNGSEPIADTGSLNAQVREFKRTLIIKTLARHNNNVSAAARELSVDPANLHRAVKNLKINLV